MDTTAAVLLQPPANPVAVAEAIAVDQLAATPTEARRIAEARAAKRAAVAALSADTVVRAPLTGVTRAIAEQLAEHDERELRSKLGDIELAEYHARIGLVGPAMEAHIADQVAEIRARYGLDR